MLYLTTILALSHDEETLAILKGTPRVYVIFTKGWLAALTGTQTTGSLFGSLPHFLLVHMDFKEPRALTEITEGAGGAITDVASLAVKHICKVASVKTHRLSDEDGSRCVPSSSYFNPSASRSPRLAAPS
jgi:hypothetical protein